MKVVFCFIFLSAALVSPAAAYIDPGTGSILLQAILGTVAVAGAGFSILRQRLRIMLKKIGRTDQQRDQ